MNVLAINIGRSSLKLKALPNRSNQQEQENWRIFSASCRRCHFSVVSYNSKQRLGKPFSSPVTICWPNRLFLSPNILVVRSFSTHRFIPAWHLTHKESQQKRGRGILLSREAVL